MSRDQSGRSKWSREQAQNSNAIDRFFRGANSLVISVVSTEVSCLAQKQKQSTQNRNKLPVFLEAILDF